MLAGSGPYGVDPANTFVRIDFQRQIPGTNQVNTAPAAAIGGKWNSTTTCAAGNYDVWGEMITVNNNKNVFTTKTTIASVQVK